MADSAPRQIVTCFLIYVDWKPVAILKDKKKTQQLMKKAEEKNKNAFFKEMTIPEKRVQELGTNIFTRIKEMDERVIARIIDIRNTFIRESFELADSKKIEVEAAWGILSKEKGKPFSEMNYSEFNRWTLDVAQYVLIKRD